MSTQKDVVSKNTREFLTKIYAEKGNMILRNDIVDYMGIAQKFIVDWYKFEGLFTLKTKNPNVAYWYELGCRNEHTVILGNMNEDSELVDEYVA